MADDSMEISSEHGRNAGDEIDIDIDLTAGQVDDDYILQDAVSNADYGNNFHLHPSPAIHHDDLMLDDDNASYQMDDADLLHDESQQTIETESMSFATGDALHAAGNGADAANAAVYSEDHDIGLFFDQRDGQEHEATSGGPAPGFENTSQEEDIVSAPDDVLREDIETTNESNFQDIEGVGNENSHPELQESATTVRGPAAPSEEPRSPPASIKEPGPSSPFVKSNEPASEHTQNDSYEKSAYAFGLGSAENLYDLSKARDVKVVYQSMEYALFSTSESDDPDSFFLSDLSIMEKSLSEFFRAIRDIIRDDLTGEDELCISVEDLGLETNEASSPLQDVTLAQILNLHEKLLHNDGVNVARPLYLHLGTRVNFYKRFINLNEGASLGKGLSELLVWDEDSESLDDPGEGDEGTNGIRSTLESQETPEDIDDGFVPGAENGNEANTSAEYPVDPVGTREEQQTERKAEQEGEHVEEQEDHKPEREDNTLADAEHVEQIDLTNIEHKSRDDPVQVLVTNDSDHPEILPESSTEAANGENNEEEDLIDYSDEEIQYPVEQKVAGPRTDTEYQAKEELRRRSVTRQAEEKRIEQSLEQCTDINEHAYEEKHATEENELGYDEYNEDDPLHDDPSENYDLGNHSNQADLADSESQNYVSEPTGDFDNPEDFENDALDYDQGAEVEAQGYDEANGTTASLAYDGLAEEEIPFHSLPGHTEEAVPEDTSDLEVNGDAAQERSALSTASSLGAVETAESSVTLGAEEIQYEDDLEEEISNDLNGVNALAAPDNAKLEQKDEIDYEDDEEEETPVSTGSGAVSATKELPNANGKRSIAEVESDFFASRKDAKRPRS